MADRRQPKGSILVADRSERIRRDLRDFLEGSGRYRVIGEAATLGEAVELAAAESPEILLFDIDMAEEDGLNVIRGLRKLLPSAALVVAHSDGNEYDAAAQEAGAAACVAKTRLFETIVPAVELAIEEVRKTGKRNGKHRSAASRPPRGLPYGELYASAPFAPGTCLWWRPRGWREWLAGVATFGWAMIRGIPIDSAPERSYWRHVEAAIVLMIGVLLIGLLGGRFHQADNLSRGMVLIALLVLAGAQFRQIRRLSSSKRADENYVEE